MGLFSAVAMGVHGCSVTPTKTNAGLYGPCPASGSSLVSWQYLGKAFGRVQMPKGSGILEERYGESFAGY